MKKEVKKLGEMNYILALPDNFDENKKYPLIVMLHGAGSRGTDITPLYANPYFSETEVHNLEAVTFAPQCYTNTWFDIFEELQSFIEFAIDHSYVDKERIYLMGASMGGYATWQMAMSRPELFAAIVPICGGGMYWNAERLKNMGVWAFHGEVDDVVFPEESRKMVDYVNMKGGKAKLTICEGVCHNSWLNAYRSAELFEWLFEHRRSAESIETSGFKGAKQFG